MRAVAAEVGCFVGSVRGAVGGGHVGAARGGHRGKAQERSGGYSSGQLALTEERLAFHPAAHPPHLSTAAAHPAPESQPAAAKVLTSLLDKLRSAAAQNRRGRLAVVRTLSEKGGA